MTAANAVTAKRASNTGPCQWKRFLIRVSMAISKIDSPFRLCSDQSGYKQNTEITVPAKTIQTISTLKSKATVAVLTIGPGVICPRAMPFNNVCASIQERTSTISWNISGTDAKPPPNAKRSILNMMAARSNNFRRIKRAERAPKPRLLRWSKRASRRSIAWLR